jgi:hypothetical protein
MNYLSRPYQQNQPVSMMPDLNLAINTIDTLQTRYDANKAIVDQMMSQFEMLKGLRDSDNEYIANKVSQVKSQMDSYGNLRLEHSSTKDSITKTLQGVLKDPIVRDAIQSKAVYDNYNASVAELKKKNPELYNDANYQYGLYQGGMQDYMSGKTNKLGSVSYTPYTDLNEETLKKLKTIKDIKGKRFIEENVDENGNVDPNGKYKRRKEIDGLTEQEIGNYFGSMLGSQEINQIKINGWAKYAQPNTIETGRKLYSDYTGQLIKNKEALLLTYEANAKNKNLGSGINTEYQRKAEQLKYEVEGLKKIDVSKISPDAIAFELEKTGYVNSISNMAASEWSTSIDINNAYYKDKELEMDLMKYDLDVKQYELEKTKLKTEFGVDEFGNSLVDANVAKSSKETDLEDMTETQAGLKSMQKEYQTASQGIMSTTKEFLAKASKEDRESFLKYLKARGINENLEFEKQEYKGKYSLENTVYEAFEAGGFASSYSEYGKALAFNKEIKSQKAQELVAVESEGYKKIFEKNPDKYINFLQRASEDLKGGTYIPTALNPFSVPVGVDKKALSISIENFVKEAGGWKNLKNYLSANPQKLSTFANLTDKADREFKGLTPILKNAVSMANIGTSFATFMGGSHLFQSIDQNLKEDASAEIESTIQNRTKSGLMTSVYSDFTFRNDNVKESVLKMIPNERTFIKGTTDPYTLDRTKNANISFYKRGDDIVITQEQTLKKGEAPLVTETVLSSADAGYQELLKYVDFEPKKQGIKATTETSLPPVKINMTAHENDDVTKKRKQYSVATTLQNNPNLQAPFGWAGGNPIAFAASLTTRETAKPVVEQMLKLRGVSPEKIKEFSDKLFANINSYKTTVKSIPNMSATGYTFGVDITKGEDSILFTELGTDEIDENTNYLLKYHSQTILLNDLLKNVRLDNIDNYINRF